MSITETLLRLAETEPSTPYSKPMWFFPWVCCSPQTINVLVSIADAARELRDATRKYEAVSTSVDADIGSPKWHEASRAQHQAERDLDAALEALAKVEG